MFKQPLHHIAFNHPINPSLDNPSLPAPYTPRWGASVSQIAYEASRLGLIAPKATDYDYIDVPDLTNYQKDFKKENIYPQLLGDVVEFLAARMTLGKEQAETLYFPQACQQIYNMYFSNPCVSTHKNESPCDWDDMDDERQYTIIQDLKRLNNILNRIDESPLSDDGIVAACELIAFWNTPRGGRKRFSADRNLPVGTYAMDIIPGDGCIELIRTLVYRIFTFFDKGSSDMQSYQYTYPIELLESHDNGVNGGRLDFVADNIIWDVKTDAGKISNQNKLQVLIYLVLMQRVDTKDPIINAGIINTRMAGQMTYDIDAIDPELIYLIDTLIDYDWEHYYQRKYNGEKDTRKRVPTRETELKALIDDYKMSAASRQV